MVKHAADRLIEWGVDRIGFPEASAPAPIAGDGFSCPASKAELRPKEIYAAISAAQAIGAEAVFCLHLECGRAGMAKVLWNASVQR